MTSSTDISAGDQDTAPLRDLHGAALRDQFERPLHVQGEGPVLHPQSRRLNTLGEHGGGSGQAHASAGNLEDRAATVGDLAPRPAHEQQRVVFTELPKTSTGKIQKFVLRERAENL